MESSPLSHSPEKVSFHTNQEFIQFEILKIIIKLYIIYYHAIWLTFFYSNNNSHLICQTIPTASHIHFISCTPLTYPLHLHLALRNFSPNHPSTCHMVPFLTLLATQRRVLMTNMVMTYPTGVESDKNNS